jgi:hypothetical protein
MADSVGGDAVEAEQHHQQQQPESLQDHISRDGVEAANLLRWRVPNTTPTKRQSSRSDTFPRSPKSDTESSLPPSPKTGESPSSKSKGCKQRSKAHRHSAESDEDSVGDSVSEANSDIDNSYLFRHRLYSYLFRNLNRALDELYYLCETESCPEHCEETARVLEGSRQDFIKVYVPVRSLMCSALTLFLLQLCERITLQSQSEPGFDDSGELRNRKALAWEVRTPRPGVVGQNPVITAALEKIAKADEGE